jgi:two-component system response regulator AtoC
MNGRVLIIDDERNLRESLAEYLSGEGFEALTADSGERGKAILETERIDAVVVDLRMPGMSGLDVLSWLKEGGPATPALMISAHGDVADAVAAMKLGAADYLVKPFDPAELAVRLGRAVGASRALASARALSSSRTPVGAPAPGDDWIGGGSAMAEIRRLIDRVAATNSTVLITGESGTGKEVVARRLHGLSARADGPFVAINLGGLPETLLESELFGYERGAFTGADNRKPGLFELAAGGTLFLDEIGDMPMPLQVKLLRVLQDKRLTRLGATRQIPIDSRIIAATNRDLEAAVRAERFREDLFYRLNVIRLRLPPLRERREDIPALAERFLARFAREMAKPVRSISPDAVALLRAYDFPGNVRELENAVERALILADGQALDVADFSFAGAKMRPEAVAPLPADALSAPVGLPLREMERRAIMDALDRHGGRREESARELGITRRTLLNKLREYGL